MDLAISSTLEKAVLTVSLSQKSRTEQLLPGEAIKDSSDG